MNVSTCSFYVSAKLAVLKYFWMLIVWGGAVRYIFSWFFHYVLQNSNILSAVLCLVKELDYPSLEVVEMAVRCRMDELDEWQKAAPEEELELGANGPID